MNKKWTRCTIFQLGDREPSLDLTSAPTNPLDSDPCALRFRKVLGNFLCTPEDQPTEIPVNAEPPVARLRANKKTRSKDNSDLKPADSIDDRINRVGEFRTKIALNPSSHDVEFKSFVAECAKQESSRPTSVRLL